MIALYLYHGSSEVALKITIGDSSGRYDDVRCRL
jgi:hypothetical protein